MQRQKNKISSNNYAFSFIIVQRRLQKLYFIDILQNCHSIKPGSIHNEHCTMETEGNFSEAFCLFSKFYNFSTDICSHVFIFSLFHFSDFSLYSIYLFIIPTFIFLLFQHLSSHFPQAIYVDSVVPLTILSPWLNYSEHLFCSSSFRFVLSSTPE